MKVLVALYFMLLFPFVAVAHKEPGKYIFFLHNRFLEEAGIDDLHPEYGKCEYREIIKAFEKEGFTVISEIRKKNTDGDDYAEKVKKQIDDLMKKGVEPSDITVVGTSKGAYIAWVVSSLMKNKDMNFVVLGICSRSMLANNPGLDFCGNVLSIYERSDELGQSCASFRELSKCTIPHYKEIELNTGLKHGFLYKASPGWINPAIEWARGNYDLK